MCSPHCLDELRVGTCTDNNIEFDSLRRRITLKCPGDLAAVEHGNLVISQQSPWVRATGFFRSGNNQSMPDLPETLELQWRSNNLLPHDADVDFTVG